MGCTGSASRRERAYPPTCRRERYAVDWVRIGTVTPSPENIDIYGEVADDEQMDALCDSIRKRGLEEPILVSRDGFILSGHRRHYACQLLGWTHVPVRIRKNISRKGNTEYHRELIEYNPQRIKRAGSLLKEALLQDNDVADTYAAIEERRDASMHVDADFMDVAGIKGTTPISERRREFLAAVQKVIDDLQDFHPLSIRQIHYRLLNDPPLKQTPQRSKYDLEHYRYRNDKSSYDSSVDLLTSARYSGQVSMTCIDDATRPQRSFNGWDSVSQFVHSEVDDFLIGYHRDRQQDQPRHIEVFAEKNTLYRIVERACSRYYVPFSIGRGFCSIPVWRDIEKRFQQSGRKRMTLIIVSDYDPEGLELADDAIRSLRDKHDVPVDGHRIAVTREQIDELQLAEDFNPAKETSSRYDSFVERTGDTKTWEAESLPPGYLVEQIQAAIEANMDMELYGRVCDQEEDDCAELCRIREEIASQLEF